MPRFVLSFGLLCVLLSTSAEARRVSFDPDAEAVASVETRVLETKTGFPPVEIDLHVSAVDIDEDGNGFHRVGVSGLYENAREGDPALSTSGVLLAVPDGLTPRVKIVSQTERNVGDVHVLPYQHRSRCQSRRAKQFAFNYDLYGSSGTFPENKISVEEAGRLQGLRLVRVGITPMQFQPSLHNLRVTTDMKVRVEFEGTSDAVTELPGSLYDLAAGAAANREAFKGRIVRTVQSELMVIVAADSLKAGLGSLVKWLAYKGIQTKVLSASEAGGTKQAIKATLQDLYNKANPRPSYLLMVGNDKTAPAWMEKVAFEDQTAVTDYPYSLLSGTDIIPDILYGRLVADNAAELKVQVDRWIQYEAFPERNAAWYGGATTIASSEGSNPGDKDYAVEVAKALKSFTYRQVDGLFEADKSATFANVNAALSQGRSWVSYFGHGDGTSWQSTNDNVTVNEVRRLANASRLPVIFDVACLNADYVQNQPCFGKAWVTAGTPGRYTGAAAYYGGSVSISWHPPAIMSVGIAKSHFGKSLPSVGASVLGGQLYLIQQTGNNQDAKDNLTWYNLFGNPAMHLRTSVPRAYKVQTQSHSNGAKAQVLVQATDASGRGVAGLRAAALAADGATLLDALDTDNYGRATLTVDRSQLKGLSVSTTGYNAEAYKVDVTQ